MEIKICTKCCKELPATREYFSPDKQGKYGLQSQCKTCRRKHQKKYRQTEKGKVADKKAGQKYRESEKGKHAQQNFHQRCPNHDRIYRQTLIGHLRSIYIGIKQRCTNPKTQGYKYYGGRGIENRFISSDEFVNFVINDLGYDTAEKLKGLIIDRIDNDGHYEPNNIRFTTHLENNRNRKRKKRTLTKQEITAYRWCHHYFKGLTTAEAGKRMGLSQRRVQQLLQSVKRKAPQLFPILTPQQVEVDILINEEGHTFEETAKALHISVPTVSNIVEAMKKKGVKFLRRKPTVSYQKYMDKQVVEKF